MKDSTLSFLPKLLHSNSRTPAGLRKFMECPLLTTLNRLKAFRKLLNHLTSLQTQFLLKHHFLLMPVETKKFFTKYKDSRPIFCQVETMNQ
jgi:hypothetical protein